MCSTTGRSGGAFDDALDAAKLGAKREADNPIVFHDLRHSFGTMAVQAFALTDVRAYMGHADIATTIIYVHHVPKASAAAALSRIVEAASSIAELEGAGAVYESATISGGAGEMLEEDR